MVDRDFPVGDLRERLSDDSSRINCSSAGKSLPSAISVLISPNTKRLPASTTSSTSTGLTDSSMRSSTEPS
jgi:hypothetical protein